ncbi:MAG: hypothetical protein COB71_02085 [Thiotrichales bacterium]|nr:MAG: hypothetical protein COB71_02085 [Thiotrichales bacterium]
MRYIIFLSTLTSIGIASFVLYAGIQHNPMGAFCKDENLDVCDFDYIYSVVIWLSWFIPFFVGQGIVIFLISLITKRST